MATTTEPLAGPRSARLDLHDRYLSFLGCILAGYALMGKGFAYIGVPPLFIGEVTFALAVLVLLRTRCLFPLLATSRMICLCMLLAWGIIRTVPYIETNGIDALRDSVILGYALFAFTVAALLVERPARLEWVVETYSRFAGLYGLVGGFVYLLYALNLNVPVPGTGYEIPYVRAGEASVHLCGVAVFVLLGLRRVTAAWAIGFIISVAMVMPNRGAILSCLVPISLAAIVGGHVTRLGRLLFVCAVFFGIAYALNLKIDVSGGRGIGAAQFMDGLVSIFGDSKSSNFDGTKEWRLRWWGVIIEYTLHGPYFWHGKGFGINLAEADGFVVGDAGTPVLRSPHNSHLTLLARAGVPGLCLWVLTLLAWFQMIGRAMIHARRRRRTAWANLFLWVACYVMAFLIDASFDVALEGPMLGIWFWCLFGFGIGAEMVYRTIPTRDVARPHGVPHGFRVRTEKARLADASTCQGTRCKSEDLAPFGSIVLS